MSKIYSYLLEPGTTRDNHICLNCDKELQQNIKQNLISNSLKSKFPTVIANFNQQDESIILDFLKRNQISGGLFTAVYNTYVETKLAYLLLQATKQSNTDKFSEMQSACEMFKNGDFSDFKKFYLSIIYPKKILSEIGGKNHSFEINIFEEQVTDVFLQRSINNLISSINPFAVKIFSDLELLASYQDSFGGRIELPSDYILVKLKNEKNNELLL